MKTNKDSRTSRIINQFLRNRYSKETEEAIQKWLIEEKKSEEKEKTSLSYWNTLDIKPVKSTYNALNRVKAKIGIQNATIKILNYHYLLRIAAVLLPLFIIAGVYYYSNTRKEQVVEIHVPYGEKKQLTLPDGSEVTLNSGTIFKYPEKFEKKTRLVNLIGEAYFTVKKNISKPFIVKTNNLSVKVLGTKFNVKAYADDNRTITTLNSGKIEVYTKSKKTCVLLPNQQLTFNNQTTDIIIKKIPSDETIGWTSGELIFTNSSMEEILRTLERHFNVSFITDPSIIRPNEFYTVKFLKNDNLEQILNVINDVIGKFSYQRQGNKIFLKK